MKMFIVALLFAPSLSFAQIFIGNSGEGVLSDGKVYLRDLYEIQETEPAYVGKTVLPGLNSNGWMVSKLQGLGVDYNLLLRKLSDAELLHTGLGTYLMMVISEYSWSNAQNFSLEPGDPGSNPTLERVPLARRFKSTILLHEKNFKALSPEHRVALIIHEAASSLLKVQGQKCLEQICNQSAQHARLITQLIFTPDYCNILQMGQCRSQAILEMLDISANVLMPSAPNEIEISYRPYGASKSTTIKSAFRRDSEFGFGGAQLLRVCDKLDADLKNGPVVASMQLSRPGFVMQLYYYKATQNLVIDSLQIAVRIKARAPMQITTHTINDRSACDIFLATSASRWFIDSEYEF